MCAAPINMLDILALTTIALGTVLFLIEICAFLFSYSEKANSRVRSQSG
mgnify:CR=1 FL=1